MVALFCEANIQYEIEYYCVEKDYIKAAAVLEHDSLYVVAVMTQHLFSRSERQKAFDAIVKELKGRFDKEILITDDLEVYSKIIMYNKGRGIDPLDIVNIARRRAQ